MNTTNTASAARRLSDRRADALEEQTVTEPVRCPDCGARFSYQDLVFGHAHTNQTKEGK